MVFFLWFLVVRHFHFLWSLYSARGRLLPAYIQSYDGYILLVYIMHHYNNFMNTCQRHYSSKLYLDWYLVEDTSRDSYQIIIRFSSIS